MEQNIRIATPDDTKELLSIYAHYIENTPISFEYEVPGEAEFENRIKSTLRFYPWLVYEKDNKILGYAYAGIHRERAAYKWSADVTVYLDKNARQKGIGSILYSTLFKMLKQQGIYTLFAGITLPNAASEAIHEKFGFKKIAEYSNVGFKNGTWYNVGWWELELRKPITNPQSPVAFHLL